MTDSQVLIVDDNFEKYVNKNIKAISVFLFWFSEIPTLLKIKCLIVFWMC